LNGKFYAFVYQASPIITIVVPGKCPIQIIGTEFSSPEQILKSFDMTHCQVGFCGNELIHTDEFVNAIKTRTTKITTSSIHAYRLVKAYQRGYSIEKPKYCYIKNIFHEYTTDFILNPNTKIPSNTDKFYDINNLQNIIEELSKNPIVLKNMNKNYIPSMNSQIPITEEMHTIGTSYAGKDRYTFINDINNNFIYQKNNNTIVLPISSAGSIAGGPVSQKGTTVTGSETMWTPSVVGGIIEYSNGFRTPIIEFNSSTSLTVLQAQNVSPQNYIIFLSSDRSIRTISMNELLIFQRKLF